MGGYHGEEVEFGIALHDGTTEVHVSRTQRSLAAAAVASFITAKAARRSDRTVYEVAVDWKLFPAFEPRTERSLGLSVVVNDIDQGDRRSAEYGTGVIIRKRPSDFTAIRLVDRPVASSPASPLKREPTSRLPAQR